MGDAGGEISELGSCVGVGGGGLRQEEPVCDKAWRLLMGMEICLDLGCVGGLTFS